MEERKEKEKIKSKDNRRLRKDKGSKMVEESSSEKNKCFNTT